VPNRSRGSGWFLKLELRGGHCVPKLELGNEGMQELGNEGMQELGNEGMQELGNEGMQEVGNESPVWANLAGIRKQGWTPARGAHTGCLSGSARGEMVKSW